MTFGFSTLIEHTRRLGAAWFDKALAAGITHVELLCHRPSFDYRDAGQVREIARWFRGAPLAVHSLRTPPDTANIVELERIRRRDACDEVKRALEVLESVPSPWVVQHLGVTGQEFDERHVDAAFASLEELNVFVRDRGASILIENIPNQVSTPDRLMRLFEVTHLRNGVCFDAGHANIGEGVEPAWSVLSGRVRLVHFHDNDGERDTHAWPLLGKGGTVDWKKLMRLLRALRQQPVVILEPMEAITADPFGAARETMERLEEIRTEEEDE